MSEIERRALLGVAGVAGMSALAAMAKAGPLSPPAGAVAPTNHTLDEIYNRITANGAAEGRIPIAGGTVPITISAPGSYVLTGNIDVTGQTVAITIAASGVTLDLNGYRVVGGGPGTGGAGILINTGIFNVIVRNGIINKVTIAVRVEANSSSLLFENIVVTTCGHGISTFLGCNNVRIRGCTLSDIGGDDAAPITLGIRVQGNNSVVEQSSVMNTLGSATGGAFGIHIVGNACVVRECSVQQLNSGVAKNGIVVSGQCNLVTR
ncbi:MAG: hypothetical protein ACREJO_07880, partial [Phycisphaerales bacterium]